MKIRKGFLTVLDDKTKKEVPFFVRSRNEDIDITKKLNIDEIFTKTSKQWVLVNTIYGLDCTIYRYSNFLKGSTQNESAATPSTDGNGEKVYNKLTNCEIVYKLYFDGRYEINGRIKLSWSVNNTLFNIQLPYALHDMTYRSISSLDKDGVGDNLILYIKSVPLSETNFSTDTTTKYDYLLSFMWNTDIPHTRFSDWYYNEPVGIHIEGFWK